MVDVGGPDNFLGLGIIPSNHYFVKIYISYNFLDEVSSTYQNRANAVNQVAAANMVSGQLTPTGQYYKDMIRKNT